MKKALERYTQEMKQKTEAVSASFARVEEAGKDIAELARKLDSTASQLSSAAELGAGNVAETSEFTGALTGMPGDGVATAAALDVTMKQVPESSSGITDIIEAIEDFAERTIMLAMNAAMEAAHAV